MNSKVQAIDFKVPEDVGNRIIMQKTRIVI